MKLFSESLRERKTRKTKRRTTNDVDPLEFNNLVAESISASMGVDGFIQEVCAETDQYIKESNVNLDECSKEVVKLIAEAGFAETQDQGGFKGMVKKVIDFIKKIFNKVVDFIKGLIGKVSNTAKQFKKARNEFQNLIDYLDTQKLPSSAELTYQKADWVGALNYIGGSDDGHGVFVHSAYESTTWGEKVNNVSVSLSMINQIAKLQTKVLSEADENTDLGDILSSIAGEKGFEFVDEGGELTIVVFGSGDKKDSEIEKFTGGGFITVYDENQNDGKYVSSDLYVYDKAQKKSGLDIGLLSDILDAWGSGIGTSNNKETQNKFIAKVYSQNFSDHLKDMDKLEGKSDEDFKEKVKEAVYGEDKDTKTYKGGDITKLVTKIWEDGFEALDMSRVIQALEDGKDDFVDKAEQFEDAGSELQSAVDRVQSKADDDEIENEGLVDEVKAISDNMNAYSAAAGVYQTTLVQSYTFAESFASQISQDLIKLAKKANKVAKDKGSKSDDEGDDS